MRSKSFKTHCPGGLTGKKIQVIKSLAVQLIRSVKMTNIRSFANTLKFPGLKGMGRKLSGRLEKGSCFLIASVGKMFVY